MRLPRYSFSDPSFVVSIHASVKDATWQGVKVCPAKCFNPRICKRCDHSPSRSFLHIKGFNPRICKRCDAYWPTIRYPVRVSIHASVKDATDSVLPKWLTYRVSIHASVKDATGNWIKTRELFNVSIHASVKDATIWSCKCYLSILCFNPRICKRCD